jgi:hypothetical protein
VRFASRVRDALGRELLLPALGIVEYLSPASVLPSTPRENFDALRKRQAAIVSTTLFSALCASRKREVPPPKDFRHAARFPARFLQLASRCVLRKRLLSALARKGAFVPCKEFCASESVWRFFSCLSRRHQPAGHTTITITAAAG